MQLTDVDAQGKFSFINERKFAKECKVFKHPTTFKDVIDIFIFQNQKGDGYSMYLVCQSGILMYLNVDKKDHPEHSVITRDLHMITLTPGAIDCDARGRILFDFKSSNNNHQIKSFVREKQDDKYDYALEKEKKVLKFFNGYVIEVKTENKMDSVQIYDFENKLCVFNA